MEGWEMADGRMRDGKMGEGKMGCEMNEDGMGDGRM